MYLEKGTLISGDAGHNSSPDIGANGYRQEDDLTKEVWNLVQAKLKDLEYAVVDCTPWGTTFNSVNGSLAYRVKVANNSGSKLHLCIHFNAGGGTGVECWVIPGGKSEQYGDKICEEISNALGIRNRGVKDGSGLYVPKYTSMPCVLIECSFVDSQNDMDKYNGEKIANAIVKAITDNNSGASNCATSIQETVKEDMLYGVTTASVLNVRDGASTFNSILGTLPKGTKVKISPQYSKGDWYSIYYGNNGGFIHKDYVNINGQEGGLQEPIIEEKPIIYGTVKVNSVLNVRDGASTNSSIIGQLSNGEKVKIDKRYSQGDFYSIYYGNSGGFIHKDYVILD
ncbi:N-acetylmuramoyl-L-alanine amidase [Clostridium algidicarnis]|uniref:N-acetylmuramoyl-L-alanine amidase n=1 Tax=Clostridium algidicarnis TaxID=37659 RepID=UPI001C0A9969|nr:N-acetylmuramoyl-L-alanine amidase [Clostridium algidicarnis]MBU3193451.1 N-acetylmuramoyl-L-alanine amidase [Clostridium algidicarnis]MBU3203144.1 N-acetylmuramoyl-L-alanine amidase [Clostridium algidicarnis]MBU3211298.1 N-acetylmuramoyl-L-alanine amidase [Clostridium algidicarnis]MBU3222194.1 N-acetylmuramoyl-L-alanine amidase [Clostridium algidicarnis]